MRLAPLAAAAAALLALAAAAPAGAQTTVTPTVTPLTAPSPMPVAFYETQSTFGTTVPAGAPIPAGATVLQVQLTVTQGQSVRMTVTCPAGSGVIGLSPPDPTSISVGFDGPVGQQSIPVAVTNPAASGPVTEYLLCLPLAGATQTTVAAKRAPVALGRLGDVPPLHKGAKLPRGSRLIVDRLTLVPGSSLLTIRCGAGREPALAGASVAGVTVAPAAPNLLIVRAPSLTAAAGATVSTLCVNSRNV